MLTKKKNILVAICFMITFLFVGCSDPKNKVVKNEEIKPKVEDSLNKYLEALKNYDEKTIAEYSATKPRDFDVNDDKKEEEIIKLVMGKIEYSIESVTINGDTATAKVKTKAIDFDKIIQKFVKQRLSAVTQTISEIKNDKKDNKDKTQKKEDVNIQSLREMVTSKDCSMKEKTITVYLSAREDKWVVDNNEDVIKSMFNVRLIDEVNK